MNTPTKVAGFVTALAAVFALTLGVGNAVGPDVEPATAVAHVTHGAEESETAAPVADGADFPGGLMVSQDGYTLTLAEPDAAVGDDVPVVFTITGPNGEAVTAYDTEHEKQLHLIAVRRDFTGFQHVHPELSPDGIWSAGLDLTAGQWRLFADFKATGAGALTLGVDLAVAGDYVPVEPADDTRTAQVDGGYTVTLEGDLTAGADAKLTLAVERDGKPVTDLEPYLGAYGHLVALRSGDLAYLHVHPDGTPDDGTTQPGPNVVFYAAVPSAGTYHLYLNFKHQGVVRTAAFTVSTSGEAATPLPDDSGDAHTGH